MTPIIPGVWYDAEPLYDLNDRLIARSVTFRVAGWHLLAYYARPEVFPESFLYHQQTLRDLAGAGVMPSDRAFGFERSYDVKNKYHYHYWVEPCR